LLIASQGIVATLAETPAFFLGRPTAEICRVVEFEPHKPCKQSCIEICPELWIVPGEDIVPVMVFRELGANQIGNLTWMPTKRQHRNGQPAYAGLAGVRRPCSLDICRGVTALQLDNMALQAAAV